MHTPKKRNEAPRKRRLSKGDGMPNSGHSYAPMSPLGGNKMNKSPLGTGYNRMYDHSKMEYSPADYSPLDNDLPGFNELMGIDDMSPIQSFLCDNDMFVPGILDNDDCDDDW